MATKRRSYIFARSRVIELPLTDRDSGRLLSSMPVDTRRRQGRLKMNYSPLGWCSVHSISIGFVPNRGQARGSGKGPDSRRRISREQISQTFRVGSSRTT